MAKNTALKGRIRSVRNTRKITKTMELVATSKLKRATDRVAAARPYAEALRDMLGDLVTPDLADRFRLLRTPAAPSKGGPARAALILLTSNRGLAGAFNSNLIKEARRRLTVLEGEGYTVDLYTVGKKGASFFRYLRRPITVDRPDVGDKPEPRHAEEVVTPLIEAFERGEIGRVELVQARFLSALSTPPTTIQILPIDPPKRKGPRPDYLLAPNADAILGQLLALYVRNAVYRGLVETVAGEQGARRTAMKNATDNATDLLGLLQRTFNRQRQAAITQEISEIVGGSAALQG